MEETHTYKSTVEIKFQTSHCWINYQVSRVATIKKKSASPF